MGQFDPTKETLAKCQGCGRRVVDGSTDFGGVVFRPTCEGIQVSVNLPTGRVYISEDELRTFLERAYGD